VLSGRGLCDGLITRPEESYRLWRVVVCDLESSKMRRLKPAMGLWEIQPKGCNAKETNKQQQTRILYLFHLHRQVGVCRMKGGGDMSPA